MSSRSLTLHYLLFFLLGTINTVLIAADAAKPNVLIVLIDDAGYGDFGCHGHPFLKTPSIDQLHGQSIRLTDFHVAPMCSPTRGQLLTGCHGLRTGVTSVTAGRTFLRPEFITAPQTFAAAGYRTGIFGKWHLGDNYPHRPQDKGFHDTYWLRGWGFTSAPEFDNKLIAGRMLRGEKPENFSGYVTDVCFDEAMRWMLRQQQEERPFFCYLPLHAAHAPHTVPEKYSAAYAGKPAPNFFGMIANIDENIGRLDAFLEKSGLSKNTYVILLTDNGGTAGVKTYNAGLRGGKVSYYDGGHRVPCFIRFPTAGLRKANGAIPSGEIDSLTQVQDLFPTLLELCDVPKLAGPAFDGVSLIPLIMGNVSHLPDRIAVVQYGPGAGQADTRGPKKFDCAVLWNKWRLVHGAELYDVATDRAQENNVADANPAIVNELRQRYETWWNQVEFRLRDFVPVSIGGQENPALLTSSDWQDTYADNSMHIRNAAGGTRGGPWNVLVEKSGEYEIVLRRWPFEVDASLDENLERTSITPPGKALPITGAKITIAEIEKAVKADKGDKQVTLRVRLPAGKTQLRAWFQDQAGNDLCGAYYAQVMLIAK